MGRRLSWLLLGMVIAGWMGSSVAQGDAPPAGSDRDAAAAGQYAGRTVESVRVIGNTRVSTSVILQLVRTREGEKFDPATVVGDYQRIYDKMKRFADVEARVQPTASGVIVIFVVTEQKQIKEIRYHGNVSLTTHELEEVADLKPDEAIDQFRVNLAQQSIEKLYRDKNYPFAHASWSPSDLQKSGVLVFNIVEGPQVRVRKVDFIGNNSFSAWKLKDQIKTGSYIFIFNPGLYDPDLVDEDVSSLTRFYRDKGFFDIRVGRKLSRSSDMKQMQITFVIDEGVRYVIDQVLFEGNLAVSEGTLRKPLKSVEGVPYDKDGIDRDVREIVKAYSAAGGYIYEEQPGIEPNPEYLRITPQPYYEKDPGKVRLVYEIREGKQFRQGRILIKGNSKTQDKVILRELHMRPGQRYDSAGIEDAEDRLRGLPEFQSVSITPVGDDPETRDLLVDVTEQRTAQISAGIGINSNGGFGGQLGYEQQNFDIANFPTSWDELFSDRGFTGAGQDFSIRFDPGTQETDASISFFEPYLFDQPYSFGSSLYYQTYIRPVYNDDRVGGGFQFGHHFNYVYSASVSLGAADVDIKNLEVPYSAVAPEILAGAGHHTLTTVSAKFQRDTTNHGPVTYEGTNTWVSFTDAGAMGGTVDYDRVQMGWTGYQQVSEDLLGRRSVVNVHLETGDDPRKAPFYERFYGGGIGTVRGFEYWGVSPRSGPFEDAVGGDYYMTGGVQYEFPLAEDFLRGVLFVDTADYEPDWRYGVIRTSVGFGFRLVLPFLGKQPLALDFGFPIIQSRTDNLQVLSFSFGFSR
ncbi:MAG: POTRA domain-containing protein [Tepidisphaeraceae bacterium]